MFRDDVPRGRHRGSGYHGDILSPDDGVVLLGNTLATWGILYVLISVLGGISGAHFNPVVSCCFWLQREQSSLKFALFVPFQVGGASSGATWPTPCSRRRSTISMGKTATAGRVLLRGPDDAGLLTIFGGIKAKGTCPCSWASSSRRATGFRPRRLREPGGHDRPILRTRSGVDHARPGRPSWAASRRLGRGAAHVRVASGASRQGALACWCGRSRRRLSDRCRSSCGCRGARIACTGTHTARPVVVRGRVRRPVRLRPDPSRRRPRRRVSTSESRSRRRGPRRAAAPRQYGGGGGPDGLVVRDAALVETRASSSSRAAGPPPSATGAARAAARARPTSRPWTPFRCAVPRVHVVNRHGVAVSHTSKSAKSPPGTSTGPSSSPRSTACVAAGAQRAPGLVGRRPGLVGHPGDRCADGVAVVPRSLRRGLVGGYGKGSRTRCLTRGPGPQPSSRRCNE